MSKRQYIVGNWKMNGKINDSRALVIEISDFINKQKPNAEVIICPPATLLSRMFDLAEGDMQIGGQDCHHQPFGAHTGDISADLLKDTGANYVILGHSERRQNHGETNKLICNKASEAIRANLIPIICVGESLAEKEESRTIEIIENQIIKSLPQTLPEQVIIAYEPVWAIGTGKIPTLDDINMIHSAIIGIITKERNIAAEKVSVLYGGSVKSDNAKNILAIDSVGGVLVGGASLNAKDFCNIISATKLKTKN